MQLLLPLILFGAMYVLLILPQQKRMKAQKAMLSDLQPGTYVMTSAGIYGTITELEDDTMLLEISEGIEIRVAKGAVARKIDTPTADGPTGGAAEAPSAEDDGPTATN